MSKTGYSIIFAATLLFSVTLTSSIAWSGPPVPLPSPREVDIEYLEALQRDLPENYVEVVRHILENNREPYIRERCIYALADIAINMTEAEQIIDYLKDLAMQEEADSIRTSAYASIDLIRKVYPQDKKGSLEVYVSGDVIKGSSIVLVAKISSTIDIEEEAIVGINALHDNIELLSGNAVQRIYLFSNEPQEVKFELQLNETGNYFIPVTFLLSFDRIEYEEHHKKLYIEVNDEPNNCLDDENPNQADYEPDGDVDGSDLVKFREGYGGADQACYDIQWFAQLFGSINSYDHEEPGPGYAFKHDRFVAVKPNLKSQFCPSGCECLTGPDAEAKFGYGTFDSCTDDVCGYGWVGDLYMEKYCYSKIPIDECIDTDGGKNYAVKGSAPGCVDRCSEFSHPPTVVNECYAQVVDDECRVNIAYHYCESTCEDGRCLPATCDDWIQNQGEEGVDCGGPCVEECRCFSDVPCKCATGIAAADHFGEESYMTCTTHPCGEEWDGDLLLLKHCYKKIESSDCYDTDGGADIYEKGSTPDCVDTCTSDRMLEECLAIPTIPGCRLTSSPWECAGSCVDGACMIPTCDDGIQNQDEVSVDCSVKSIYSDCSSCCNNGIQDYDEEDVDCGGSQCIPCGFIQIKGKILYEDSDDTTGEFKPVRHGNFYIRLCPSHPCISATHQGDTTTDSLGYFYFSVPYYNSKSAYIRLGYEHNDDPYYFNYAARIAKDLDDCHETVWWHSASREIPDSRIVDFGELRIGMNTNIDFNGYWQEETDAVTCGGGSDESGSIAGGSAYFNIADAILYGRQYADGKRSDNDNIGYVDVQWPDSSDTSSYNPMFEEITLEGTDGFADGTINHEYAHYLQDAIGTSDDYWGDPGHGYCTSDKDEEFAWKEGFAEYYGTIVPLTYTALSNPNVAYMTIESPYCFEGRDPPCCSDAGNESEATVSAVLWDLADLFTNPISESFDNISGRETLIFNIFDDELDNGDSIAADAPDLCEFIEQGINCRISWPDYAGFLDIFEHYYVDCGTGCDN